MLEQQKSLDSLLEQWKPLACVLEQKSHSSMIEQLKYLGSLFEKIVICLIIVKTSCGTMGMDYSQFMGRTRKLSVLFYLLILNFIHSTANNSKFKAWSVLNT